LLLSALELLLKGRLCTYGPTALYAKKTPSLSVNELIICFCRY